MSHSFVLDCRDGDDFIDSRREDFASCSRFLVQFLGDGFPPPSFGYDRTGGQHASEADIALQIIFAVQNACSVFARSDVNVSRAPTVFNPDAADTVDPGHFLANSIVSTEMDGLYLFSSRVLSPAGQWTSVP